MDIGIIGLGHMGQAMARTLLRAGHSVVVYNRTRKKAEALRGDGAKVANEIRDACQGDAVITMLSDDAAVEAVTCRPHGVLDSLAPNKTIHVSSSTISPRLVQSLVERHRERNLSFLSAPVLGRPAAAEQGALSVLVAGDRDLIDVMQPCFDALGSRTLVIGDAPPAANLVKVSCNSIIATVIEAIGETLALVTKSGLVDAKTYIDVLLQTVLGTPLYKPYGDNILNREFTPGFKLPLALKDIELALAVGKDSAVPLPLASLIRDHMLEAIAAGYGDSDWAALSLVPQHDAGLAQ